MKKFIISFMLTFIVGCLIVGCLLVGSGLSEKVKDAPASVNTETEIIIDSEQIVPSISSVVGIEDGNLNLKYTLENLTLKDQKVTFNGGRKLLYVIKNDEGKEVYNSKDEMQTLAIEEILLKKGETTSFDIKVEDLETGLYSVDVNFNGDFENEKLEVNTVSLSDIEVTNTHDASVKTTPVEPKPVAPVSEKKLQVLEVEGTFVGWADGHTVEITTSEGPVAFQVSENVIDKLSVFEESDKLTVFYTYDDVTKNIVDVK